MMSMNMPDSASSIRVTGKASTMSAAREMEKSAQRRGNRRSGRAPFRVTTATSVALIAMTSENVSPSTTRESVSRPVPAPLPAFVHDIPPNGPIGSRRGRVDQLRVELVGLEDANPRQDRCEDPMTTTRETTTRATMLELVAAQPRPGQLPRGANPRFSCAGLLVEVERLICCAQRRTRPQMDLGHETRHLDSRRFSPVSAEPEDLLERSRDCVSSRTLTHHAPLRKEL